MGVGQQQTVHRRLDLMAYRQQLSVSEKSAPAVRRSPVKPTDENAQVHAPASIALATPMMAAMGTCPGSGGEAVGELFEQAMGIG